MAYTEKELEVMRYYAERDKAENPYGLSYTSKEIVGLFDVIDEIKDSLAVSNNAAMSAISRAETAENLLKESVKQLTEITEMVNKWKRDYGSGSQIEIVFGKQVVSVDTVVKSVLKILEGSE